jgi:hypothetical protein
MRNTKLILGLAAVVLFLAGVAAVLVWRPWADETESYVAEPGYYQKTIGRENLQRNTSVVQDGDWTYYVDRNGDGNIYKIHKGETTSELVAKVGVTAVPIYLQLWDGWLYYHNEDKDGISRVRLDGSNKEDLTMMLGDTSIKIHMNLSIVDGTIYGMDSLQGSLYKMDLDGSNVQVLVMQDVMAYSVYNDWVFYCYEWGKREQGIFKMRLDGSDRQRVGESYDHKMIVDDSWIYYKNGAGDKFLYRVRDNGEDKALILNQKDPSFVVVDDWVYTGSLSGEFFRVRLDGSEASQIADVDGGVTDLQYAGGWLYYFKREEGSLIPGPDDEMYRMRLDGTGEERVTPVT